MSELDSLPKTITWRTHAGKCITGRVICVARAGETVRNAIARATGAMPPFEEVLTREAQPYERYVARVSRRYYARKIEGFERRVGKAVFMIARSMNRRAEAAAAIERSAS
jgi:hypothetical protein